MKMRTEYTCPLELVHDMIKGKWKPIILWRLRLGATSLAKLERDIDGITQKMLLEQLKELMDYGFVEKKSYEGYPLRVEYSLTDDMGIEILESVAYVVSMRLGLDTSRYSVSYIKSWLKDKDELKIVADTVQKVAAKIINNLAESSDSAFSDLREESEDKENE